MGAHSARSGTNVARIRAMNGLVQDLSYALRSLMQRPGLWLVATLALGLGIGANTAIFTVVDAVLLQPLPWKNTKQLVSIVETVKGEPSGPASGPNFLDLKTQ